MVMPVGEFPLRQRESTCPPVSVNMVWASRVAGLLKALADPTRMGILAALASSRRPVCICDLTAAFDLSQPTISHHMAKLKTAGLVTATRRGICVYHQLRPDLPPEARRLLEALLPG